uniref:Uncharacterized protein n=1 Tax=Panagrolaimus sp. JU765 TaxID=591449 RepID=A0AC34RQE5_9BILA
MITSLGNWRSKTFYTLPGVIDAQRNACVLKENVNIIPKENNDSLTGIYLIPDILYPNPEKPWANYCWTYYLYFYSRE